MNIQSSKKQIPNLEGSSEFGIFTQQLFTTYLLCAEHYYKEEFNLKQHDRTDYD